MLITAVAELMIHDLPSDLLYLQHTRTSTPESLLQIVTMHNSVFLFCFLFVFFAQATIILPFYGSGLIIIIVFGVELY